jgi:hypothetical protein
MAYDALHFCQPPILTYRAPDVEASCSYTRKLEATQCLGTVAPGIALGTKYKCRPYPLAKPACLLKISQIYMYISY